MTGPVQSFTKKFEDQSTDKGFKFVFFCDIGGEEVHTTFVHYGAGGKAEMGRLFGKGLSIASTAIPGMSGAGQRGDALMGAISDRYGKMSPDWHKKHDMAFESAQTEAKGHLRQCPQCRSWACPHCWDEQKSMCINDAKQTICPQCHQPAGTGKFCNNCGSPLARKCLNCGAESSVGTAFCGACGTKL